MFTLHRTGQFKATEHTDNQCKAKGHSSGYNYHITIIVDKLDAQGFAIDHEEIDQAIQNIKIKGSCEELCLLIFNTVEKLKFAGTLVAYKSEIKPVTTKLRAFMQYQWHNPNYKKSAFWLSTI